MDDIVSPSKAQSSAAEARDWAAVDDWLTRVYAPARPPSFERNQDTRAALLALAAVNDTADADRTLIHRAQSDAVHILATDVGEAAASTPVSTPGHNTPRGLPTTPDTITPAVPTAAELFDAADAALPAAASAALDDLAATAALLSAVDDDASPLSLAAGIADLVRLSNALERQLHELAVTRSELERQTEEVRRWGATAPKLGRRTRVAAGERKATSLGHDNLADTDTDTESEAEAETEAVMAEQIALWTRETKLLGYQPGNAPLADNYPDQPPRLTITDVRIQEESVERLRATVAVLEARLATFNGLPPDARAARDECARLERECREKGRRRDELVAKLTDQPTDAPE